MRIARARSLFGASVECAVGVAAQSCAVQSGRGHAVGQFCIPVAKPCGRVCDACVRECAVARAWSACLVLSRVRVVVQRSYNRTVARLSSSVAQAC
eukprot:5201459-Lingulodinium_polyedra.AAC.1